MTQLDQPTREVRPPRRSWRDLPASPPVADLIPPPDPSGSFEGTAPTQEATRTDVPTTGGPAPDGDRPQRRSRIRYLAIGGALVMVGLVGGMLALRAGNADSSTTPTVSPSESGSPSAVATALGPAVVQIELFGGLDAGGGVGSGVIYDTAGLVLTAHHVVSMSDEVTVQTSDERSFTGRVVGRVPERDLAIVALDGAEDLVAAPIAETGSVEVGEPAIALGSPFGFQLSVTAGIISGLDRELETPFGTLTGLIQTDAPINPGNSGGPLADAEAKVIGINTAIASMSGGNDGVGFAIPIEDFASLIEEVEAGGGVDAPTIPAPEDAGNLGSLLPGLEELLPGLEELLPGLEELLPGLDEGTGELPGLEEMLDELFGPDSIPPELRQLLDELFGVPAPMPGGQS